MASESLPLFQSYCYGPADLLTLRKGDSTMWLSLRDPAGKLAEAVYHGCVYWQLEQPRIHLSLVQRLSTEELMLHCDSPALRELRKNTSDVEGLLREWESEGLCLFLHLGNRPDAEFLVVARSLEYRETT